MLFRYETLSQTGCLLPNVSWEGPSPPVQEMLLYVIIIDIIIFIDIINVILPLYNTTRHE